mgnify:CR=1 FL=1
MKKETLLHSKKIQKMITQYKHDMQLVDQLDCRCSAPL